MAAEECGFIARAAKGSLEDLEKEKCPCIAHGQLEGGLSHFLIILKITDKYVKVADPGKGIYKMSLKEFETFWIKQIVLLLDPSKSLLNEAVISSYSWLKEMVIPEKIWLVQSIFLGMLLSVSGILTALSIQLIIDEYIPSKNIQSLIFMVSFLFFVLLLRAFSSAIRIRILANFSYKFNIKLQNNIIKHLLNLPQIFFDKHKTGDLTSRMNDALRIQKGVVLLTNDLVIQGLVLVSSLTYLFIIHVPITLLILFMITIYVLLAFRILPRIKNKNNRVMKTHAEVESNYIDLIKGQESIKLSNSHPYFMEKNRQLFLRNQEEQRSLYYLLAEYGFTMESISAMIIASFLIFGVTAVINGSMPLGQLMASYTLLGSMLPSLQGIMSIFTELQTSTMALTRLQEIIHHKMESIRNETKDTLDIVDIDIKEMVFSYTKSRDLIKNMDLHIKRGNPLIISGKNGSGKSTFSKILCGIYDMDKGDICLNGRSILDINRYSQRESIRLIPQNIYIFNGSILENIMIAQSNLDQNSLQTFFEKYDFNWFFQRFKRGFLTDISEDGRRLSGGEKFVIGLIRALMSYPQVLIIDEGLSSLDSESRTIIENILNTYASQYILCIIGHDEALKKNINTIYHFGE